LSKKSLNVVLITKLSKDVDLDQQPTGITEPMMKNQCDWKTISDFPGSRQYCKLKAHFPIQQCKKDF
jgi:hypothetical protein